MFCDPMVVFRESVLVHRVTVSDLSAIWQSNPRDFAVMPRGRARIVGEVVKRAIGQRNLLNDRKDSLVIEPNGIAKCSVN